MKKSFMVGLFQNFSFERATLDLKGKTVPLALVILFIINAAGIQAQQTLDWTLALVEVRADADLSFSQPISLKTGDSFTLYIKAAAPCYCYVIIQDSEQNVQVLQSQSMAPEDELRIPISITPPSGSETFYIIMSLAEQQDLNAKITAYQKSGASDQSSNRYSRDLIQEVFRLRRSLSSIKESAEKPVYMGGAFRGIAKSEGLEFSGSGAYVKTITINH